MDPPGSVVRGSPQKVFALRCQSAVRLSPLVSGAYPGGDSASSGRAKKDQARRQTGPETWT